MEFKFVRYHIATGSFTKDVWKTDEGTHHTHAYRMFLEQIDAWNRIGVGVWQYFSE